MLDRCKSGICENAVQTPESLCHSCTAFLATQASHESKYAASVHSCARLIADYIVKQAAITRVPHPDDVRYDYEPPPPPPEEETLADDSTPPDVSAEYAKALARLESESGQADPQVEVTETESPLSSLIAHGTDPLVDLTGEATAPATDNLDAPPQTPLEHHAAHCDVCKNAATVDEACDTGRMLHTMMQETKGV